MPSHISHSLLAEDLLSELNRPPSNFTDIQVSALLQGAQGPDIFYHNQRSMPSGLLIGSVLHRKGYGSVAARMMEYCLINGRGSTSPEGLYLLGFISHGIMDRVFHPYINYFSGWVDPDDKASEDYRYCHPFLERVIDVGLSAYRRPGELKAAAASPQPLDYYRFASRFDSGEHTAGDIHDMLRFALSHSYKRMAGDEKLDRRLRNAYRDSRGFYYYSEGARDKEIPYRWAALLHPARLPDSLDFLNSRRRTWIDPCHEERTSTLSVPDLYDHSLELSLDIASTVASVLDGGDPPEDYPGLPETLGDHGLRNNIPGSDSQPPCTLIHSDPLPLKAVLEIIAGGAEEDQEDWTDFRVRFREEVPPFKENQPDSRSG